MDAITILTYAHQHVLDALEGLDETDWDTPGVCGIWSVKDIIAHLASYEHVLTDVFHTFLDDAPTPYLNALNTSLGDTFNDDQVAMRWKKSAAAVLKEYKETHAQVMEMATQLPPQLYRETGTLPWYGNDYSLDDLIVYGYYGHKREHCAQIAAFRDELTNQDALFDSVSI